ncbi:MAG: hypothetical protein AAF389_11915 [Gemmatimonadota bacterium]
MRRSPLLVLAVAAAACGPNGPTRPVADRETVNDNREVFETPSFATDINEILQRRGCSGHNCHGHPGGRAELSLNEDAAFNYAQLVGRSAVSEAYELVLPNHPDSSYLVIKLEDRQTVGFQMPLGADPLDSIDLANVRNWIATGAPNN